MTKSTTIRRDQFNFGRDVFILDDGETPDSSKPGDNLMSCRSRIGVLATCSLLFSAGAHAGSLTEKELEEQLASFGDGFVIERLEAPKIENPHDWINRRAGKYVYRFVEGSDDGDETHTEEHIPDADNPETAWKRRVGDDLVETYTSTDEMDVLIVEEVDHEHGFRVVIEPGVHLPAGIEPGAVWEIDADLTVYDTDDGSLDYHGELQALHSYEGAFRVRTPAGEFDTVLIREDFKMKIGPLKADDDRLLFFARGVGLVAEVEGIRASAILIIRVKEHSAKVLVEYPEGIEPGVTAAQ